MSAGADAVADAAVRPSATARDKPTDSQHDARAADTGARSPICHPPHWPARLTLDYRHDPIADRTVLRDRHTGPLRVLRSLYPEGPGICHTVLVHPPGGLVGGDLLDISADIGRGAHALITTPGAARYYRSNGAAAGQTLTAHVESGGRLEWLPLETLVHPGAIAENHLRFTLDGGAEMIGWDVLALGLPASGEAFDRGRVTQCIDLPGLWLERGVIDGNDRLLLDSPLGWSGRRVLATAWFAAGAPLAAARRDALVTVARAAVDANAVLCGQAGVTSTDPRLIVLRALAPNVETGAQLLTAIWRTWRTAAWGCAATVPRLWKT